jgi:hypothetical protein
MNLDIGAEIYLSWSDFLGSNLTDNDMRQAAADLARPVGQYDREYGRLWHTCFRYLSTASREVDSTSSHKMSPLQGMP